MTLHPIHHTRVFHLGVENDEPADAFVEDSEALFVEEVGGGQDGDVYAAEGELVGGQEQAVVGQGFGVGWGAQGVEGGGGVQGG